jgi:hypothetical protein
MYGLPQAGKLTNNYLKRLLQPNNFVTTTIAGLWIDNSSDLDFALIVDEFFVRYTNKAHKDRLLNVLKPATRSRSTRRHNELWE